MLRWHYDGDQTDSAILKMFSAASAKHFASSSHGIRRIPAVCAAQDDTLVL